MRPLLVALLVLLVEFGSGEEEIQQLRTLVSTTSTSRSCVCAACPDLETLGRTVSAACATASVAALPQMAAACALAATVTRPNGGATQAERAEPLPISAAKNQTKKPKHRTEDRTLPSLLRRSDSPDSYLVAEERAKPHAASVHIPNTPGMDSHVDTAQPTPLLGQRSLDRQERATRNHSHGTRGIAAALRGRHRRVATSCSNATSVVESLQAHCAVPGCSAWKVGPSEASQWSEEEDVSLTCSDATAVAAAPFNATCLFLAQSCTVGIQMNMTAQSGAEDASLENAAVLLGNWQGSASVTLRGEWGEQRLSAVLQHAHKLENLDAGSAGITALSRHTLGQLTSLRVLDLNGNSIGSIDAGAFTALTKLQYLSLWGNKLESLPSQVFHNCSLLSYLELGGNELGNLDVSLFQGLSALNSLWLHENRLTELPGNVFQGLSRLTELSIYRNRLLAIDPMTFHALPALENLDIGRNRFVQLPVALFHNLLQLRTLFTNNNMLAHVDVMAFQGLSYLAHLDLHGNQLTHVPDGTFNSSTALHTLDLSSNKLQTLEAAAFQGLSVLNILYLRDNALDRLHEGVFVVPPQLRSLSELYMDYTGMSELHLPANTRLKYLTVAHNHRLTNVVATNSSATVADVTRSGMRIANLPCESFGYKVLVARDMPYMSALDLLNKCMGPHRVFLDVSDNGEHRVNAVRESLFSEAACFLMGADDSWSKLPEYSPVRKQAVDLVLVDSPVQCSVRTMNHFVVQGDKFLDLKPLQMFVCNCIPGYYEDGDVCRRRIPFVAKPQGIITVVLTTLLAAGLLVLCQKRFKQRLRHVRHDLEMQRSLLEYAETEVLVLKRVWEIDAEEVALVKRIDGGSEGAFGAVWRADWDGMMVAVKVLRAGLLELDSKLADEFDREADFLMRARHANVVRFFGAGRMPSGEPFVVLELVSRGSLRGLLRGDKRLQLNDALKQRIALDVARGMAYIHSLGALHRDLKSGNVLVTENWRGKVADFGSMRTLLASAAAGSSSSKSDTGTLASHVRGTVSSTLSDPRDMTLTAGVGTPLYMALEVLRGDEYGEAADVWAFGVMVWELVEQRAPDLLAETGEEGRGPLLGRLLKVLEAGKRLQLGASAPAWAQRVVEECMVAEASERPSFVALKGRLVVANSGGAN